MKLIYEGTIKVPVDFTINGIEVRGFSYDSLTNTYKFFDNDDDYIGEGTAIIHNRDMLDNEELFGELERIFGDK